MSTTSKKLKKKVVEYKKHVEKLNQVVRVLPKSSQVKVLNEFALDDPYLYETCVVGGVMLGELIDNEEELRLKDSHKYYTEVAVMRYENSELKNDLEEQINIKLDVQRKVTTLGKKLKKRR